MRTLKLKLVTEIGEVALRKDGSPIIFVAVDEDELRELIKYTEKEKEQFQTRINDDGLLSADQETILNNAILVKNGSIRVWKEFLGDS